MVNKVVTPEMLKKIVVANPLNKATAEDFQTQLQSLSLAFTFPSYLKNLLKEEK